MKTILIAVLLGSATLVLASSTLTQTITANMEASVEVTDPPDGGTEEVQGTIPTIQWEDGTIVPEEV
jgi:hypothetical protein